MPANAFEVFMAQHPPVGELVVGAGVVLWDKSALNPVVKERVRIALAETIGCSYCFRFRTTIGGRPVLEEDPQTSRNALEAERFARAIATNEVTDGMTQEMQRLFTPPEFTDLVFSIGWFIGMQHVGRLMHWDEACPVAPIRELVESGDAS
jgi:hypothetical protein